MKKRQVKNYLSKLKKLLEIKPNLDELKSLLICKNCISEDELLEEREGYIDINNIYMIIPKTKQLKKLITEHFDIIVSPLKRLKWGKQNFGDIESYYCGEYINKIFGLFKYSKTIKIKMLKDYPIQFEDENLIVILAPQVYNNEKRRKYKPSF